jgi:dTDP-4-amino-4,6-dideoxygalactose transaminase/lipopolysaccharide/colanic/teichoic acid biosynthesis glycosyltransferase
MESTPVKFLPFHIPLIEEDDIRAVTEVMKSRWLTTGPRCVQFEQDFAQFIGARHAVAVNSCTAALHLALQAIGLGEGDEVLLPTLTFAATGEAVVYCGARPVLVDSEPDTFNLDPVQVEKAITPRTRAIVPVHFAGHPCDMERILRIARDHHLIVIEDAAHALSARYRGKMIGTLGDMTCFSFYATKNITTAEGGMVTTERDDWTEHMLRMRLHGISTDAWKRYSAEGSWRYEILAPGFKYNLTDLQAALGISQLAKCQSMWARRSALAQRYTDALSSLDAFELPSQRTDVQHAWHLYTIRVCPGELSIHRNQVIEELKARGIGTSVHFIPLHLHPYYRNTWGYRPGDFRVAEDFADRCISLPLYPAMSDEDQTRVIDALTQIATIHRLLKPVASVPWEASDHASALPAFSRPSRRAASTVLQQAISQDSKTPSHEDRETTGLRCRWYVRTGKRLLDVTGAVLGLLLALPLMVVLAAVVRAGSPGPILFRQIRVGNGGRTFPLLKFRSMYEAPDSPCITAAGDPRITSAGRWLRRSKLDELPQLVNILKGDMSLVGPRPELPAYVARYTSRQRRLLAFRPGLTSPATLACIQEEDLLAAHQDHEDYYVRVLLPRKLELDLDYCNHVTLARDLKLLLQTGKRLFSAGPNVHSAPQAAAIGASGRSISNRQAPAHRV